MTGIRCHGGLRATLQKRRIDDTPIFKKYIYIYIYYTIRRKIIVKTQLLYVSRGATLFLQDVENIRQSSESLIFRHYPTTVIPRKIAFYMSYVISRR